MKTFEEIYKTWEAYLKKTASRYQRPSSVDLNKEDILGFLSTELYLLYLDGVFDSDQFTDHYVTRTLKNRVLNLIRKEHAQRRGGDRDKILLSALDGTIPHPTDPLKEMILNETFSAFRLSLSGIEEIIFTLLTEPDEEYAKYAYAHTELSEIIEKDYRKDRSTISAETIAGWMEIGTESVRRIIRNLRNDLTHDLYSLSSL